MTRMVCGLNGMAKHDRHNRTGATAGGRAWHVVWAGMLAAAMTLGSAGCSSSPSSGGESDVGGAVSQGEAPKVTAVTSASVLAADAIPTDGSPLSLIDTGGLWSDRDLDPSYDAEKATSISLAGHDAKADGENASSVSVADGKITISAGGTYVLSGKSEGLAVVIEAADDEKVQLVLDSAEMSTDGPACVYAKSADKLFLTVADGTANSLAATGEATEEGGDNIDGAVFSKCDLTINGDGNLSVSSKAGHGIVGKDEVTLVSSKTAVSAPKGHAVQAHDSIAVRDGVWELTGGTDGLHAENADDPSLGWIYVGGGKLVISAGSDGMDAASRLQVDDGEISVECGDDAIHAELDLAVNGGRIGIARCSEGIEGGTVTVTAGDVSVIARDDGINATGDPSGSGGSSTADGKTVTKTTVEAGAPKSEDGTTEDSMESDTEGEAQTNQDGTQQQGRSGGRRVKPSPIGDGQQPPAMPDGERLAKGEEPPAVPDGQAPAGMGGTDTDSDAGNETAAGGQRRQGMQPGGGAMDADESATLTISGGSLTVDSDGDGLDSNGLVRICGGTTYVWGPTSDGNSPIDSGTGIRTDGGTIVAVGSAGMAEEASAESAQASAAVFLDGAKEGEVSISLDGTEVAKCSPTKSYSFIFASIPEMGTQGTYKVKAGSYEASFEATGMATTSGTRETSGWGRPILDGEGDGEALEARNLIGRRFLPDDEGNES